MDRGLQHCPGGGDQTHHPTKEMQEGKYLSEEALKIAKKIREMKDKEDRERYT